MLKEYCREEGALASMNGATGDQRVALQQQHAQLRPWRVGIMMVTVLVAVAVVMAIMMVMVMVTHHVVSLLEQGVLHAAELEAHEPAAGLQDAATIRQCRAVMAAPRIGTAAQGMRAPVRTLVHCHALPACATRRPALTGTPLPVPCRCE